MITYCPEDWIFREKLRLLRSSKKDEVRHIPSLVQNNSILNNQSTCKVLGVHFFECTTLSAQTLLFLSKLGVLKITHVHHNLFLIHIQVELAVARCKT